MEEIEEKIRNAGDEAIAQNEEELLLDDADFELD